MALPSGTWAIALGAFGACVAAAAVAAGSPDVARLAAVGGVPIAAALAALLIARATRLDAAIARAAFPRSLDPAATIESVVACAEAARRVGPAGLPHLAADQRNPLLADGLRLIAIGAGPDVVRDALERRLEAGATRTVLRLRIAAWFRRLGPLATIPALALAAAWMLQIDAAAATPSAAQTASAAIGILVLLPLVAFAGPTRGAAGYPVAAQVLHDTITIEGLAAFAAGRHPAAIREQLSRLLPPSAESRSIATAAA